MRAFNPTNTTHREKEKREPKPYTAALLHVGQVPHSCWVYGLSLF